MTDVIVVVVILLVAMTVGLLWLTSQRELARRVQCERNFQITSEALLRYEELESGFPGWRDPIEVPWTAKILPYLDVPRTVDEIETGRRDRRTGPWKDMGNRVKSGGPQGQADLRIPWFHCPTVRVASDDRGATLTIAVNAGMPDAKDPPQGLAPDWLANGVFQDCKDGDCFDDEAHWTTRGIEEKDGVQHTLLIAENIDAGPWTANEEGRLTFVWAPPDYPTGPLPLQHERGQGFDGTRRARPASWHTDGATVAFCDGRVTLLHQAVDPIVYVRLMTVDDTATKTPGTNELLPPPWRDDTRASDAKQ